MDSYRKLYMEVFEHIYKMGKIMYYFQLYPKEIINIIIYLWEHILGKSGCKTSQEIATTNKKEYIISQILKSKVKLNEYDIYDGLYNIVNRNNDINSLVNEIIS
ncbi:Transmembrane domain-containing protein [Orpheovirus IHUMI-LCC2]|uniref:Transmembrane domain-containing protein n=1 Tax=Orpheovirus IHUMI-LCC2 TaxID=2023057 RepID=A0A2I2L322_9VIRU|nr:Transmembrane domain-containing protein [Orpheovirus IHUMI-LCC2]SNW61945.1 Transmembrane domain-containing protein [Orpheovirus IHUMI-LCC2]